MAWLIAGVDQKAGNSFPSNKSTLQILAFDAAKAMSRLVTLYNSLPDDEFSKLREGPMKSTGVAFLNSIDENYLLGLACKEKLEDLSHVVAVVSRLSKDCIDEQLKRFEITYHNMKQGIIDVNNKNGFNSRNVGKIIEKMEKYAYTTSALHSSMVALDELEVSEKKMQKWKINNFNLFDEKITFQRKQVLHFRQISLWNQTFDKTVGLMVRIVFVLYARICNIFGPFVPSLPRFYIPKKKAKLHMKVHPETNYCLLVDKDKYMSQSSKSGPIMKSSKITPRPRRSHSGELSPEVKSSVSGFRFSATRNKRLILSAPANTVGSAGLAARYANLIIMAESCFHSTTNINEETREEMFEMLPSSLKQALGKKLKGHWYKESDGGGGGGGGLAEGWKEGVEEIIGWLAPVAHDTLRWQEERDLLQQKLDAKPTVLLLQTLHFSDLEKTEAAIVEVLVGLSCIYKYENRRERHGGYCWL